MSGNVSFPCYTFLANDCSNPYVKTLSGKYALLIFSTADLLRNYRREDPDAIGPSVEFDLPGQLALYLDSLPRQITHVVIDLANGTPKAIVDVGAIYNTVLEKK